MISQAYAKALESGRRDGKGGLSPLTVKYMHRILRHALQQAVRWQLLVRNPADAVKPPTAERKEMKALDADGTAALIEAARGTRLFVPILLGVLCGMRRGEITALRWRSVDLERGQLSVVASTEQTRDSVREKVPKSGRGRTVALPSLVVEELRQHRLSQAEALLKLGVRLEDNHHVIMRADARHKNRVASLMHLKSSSESRASRAYVCMTYGTAMLRTYWLPAFIPKSRKNDLVTPALRSPSICTVMGYPACKPRQPIALTSCCATL